VLAVTLVLVVAGPLPELRPLGGLLLLAVALAALADLAFSRTGGVRGLTVGAPPVVRFAKDREGLVTLVFSRPGDGDPPLQHLRFALALPPGFQSAEEEMRIALPAGAPLARVVWRATPRERGRYAGLVACLETGSRLGFWELRFRQPVATELRVYPNLFSERRALAALFLQRGQHGAKLQRTVGRGREFEKLRDYLPGDGFDEIHWKATGKRGRPITKVFQAERTQEIYVAVDRSRLSARRVVHHGISQTALERTLTAALVLLLAAEQNGDRFGLLVYDDRVRVFIKAGHGDAHYGACREAILGLQPNPVTPDMPEIVRHLRTHLRQRALLVFLTDLTDPVLAEDFARHAPLLARQHLVLVNQLRAPGIAPLFHGEPVADAGEIHRRLAGHTRWSELQALIRTLRPQGITATLLEDETLAADLVAQYLRVKQRQLL
jgi:uncharacterized protein (DUF58 family)